MVPVALLRLTQAGALDPERPYASLHELAIEADPGLSGLTMCP
jgi:hypothetical protein